MLGTLDSKLRVLGVEIADHLIIGRNKHYSMTYNGHLNIQDILKATEDMKF